MALASAAARPAASAMVQSAPTSPFSSAAPIPAPRRVPPPPPPQHAASFSTSYSSLGQFPSDIIPEEVTEDSGCDSPVEPVTPVSGHRYSQEFTALNNGFALPLTPKRPLIPVSHATAPAVPTVAAAVPVIARDSAPAPADPTPPTPLSRRSTRSSASSFKRTVSNLFRRSSSTEKERELAVADSTSLGDEHTTQSSRGSSSRSGRVPGSDLGLSAQSSACSFAPSSPTTSLEMMPSHRSAVASDSPPPTAHDFKKKGRATTGLSFRGRAVNFVVGRGRPAGVPRRASSFDADDRTHTPVQEARSEDEESAWPLERLPWPLPPDAGTGVKARRMSVNLPDDFFIDVAELLSEFEYQHKILGRHGKHLGKGAASRVTLMVRKGSPCELYAVKEFRGKSHRESQAEYEKKIKSEFSIGKSLHHPNIVETIRLCTDHGRWNHVMEYCSEGDLFGLVQKGHLKGEDKKKDRLCLFKQLIQGVGYLHANGIAHRDIKLENLLLTKDSKLKIADFGVSEVFSGTHPGLREAHGQCGQNMGEVRLCSPGICGSEPYIAPEVLEKREQYDARALDVWSSAIVMIYLTFGGAIWSRAEAGNLHYDKLVKGWAKWNKQHPECDACITDSDYPKCLALDVGVNPPALRRLLLQMLNPDPRRRIGMDEVLGNRWMKNVECCQVESYEDQAQVIDASKKDSCGKSGLKKVFCHNHLPVKSSGGHSLGKMPGQAGY